ARRARRIESEHRIVLHVLRQGQRTALEDENAMRVRLVAREKALRENRSETATADDDQIERSGIDALRARERFVEAVADESAENIATEVGRLRSGTGHDLPPGRNFHCRPRRSGSQSSSV